MGDLGVKHRQFDEEVTVLMMLLFLFKETKVQLTGAFNQGDVPRSDVQHRGRLKIFLGGHFGSTVMKFASLMAGKMGAKLRIQSRTPPQFTHKWQCITKHSNHTDLLLSRFRHLFLLLKTQHKYAS